MKNTAEISHGQKHRVMTDVSPPPSLSHNSLITVEHVSKKYCKSLKRSMMYGIKDIGRNLLGLSSHSEKLRKDEFWAVDDVSFAVKPGETLGIIGPNGAGKTTLLKMLNGIFWPDKGKIAIRGRVSALIQVGAGFHPLLTGRENVYINAAILGMTKKEVDDKFDEIIRFADIGDFIDTPVKFYSSGMFVRLGFAVAVHCEPDILLVDEVLAVGDAAFVTRCYQKMNEIKRRNHVAIILVSHSLLSVGKFCDRGIFLLNGQIQSQGTIHAVIQDYQTSLTRILEKKNNLAKIIPGFPHCTGEVNITKVTYLDASRQEQQNFSYGDIFGIRVDYQAYASIPNPIFQISISNQDQIHLAVFGTHLGEIPITEIHGEGFVECWIESVSFLLNQYYVTVAIYDETHNITFDYWNGAVSNYYFKIAPNVISEKMAEYTPLCHFSHQWNINGEQLRPTT